MSKPNPLADDTPSPEKSNENLDFLALAREGAMKKNVQTEAVVHAVPYNLRKAGEHGLANALAPERGDTVAPDSRLVTGSTLTEENGSEKTGSSAPDGLNATIETLDRVRVDSSGRVLTTNQGVAIADNQNSLKAGLRGPALLEDFILREKITHFDHERIPERIVHARGSAAHGFFECYASLGEHTKAAPFKEAGKITPVFVRFSTVAGERGSKDTARDVRGFAVKFYTDEGNWDLVGNNMPVFFIQDAIKFPDLVHAVKPEPHNQMPQAASAHDTFWDFVSLMPESTHMLMWVMSDRGIPRSYSMMEGFGVHTFRLVNEAGQSVFCKFHWNPKAGTHSLVWDEAVKISGADPDFHRRDLWDRIEAGVYPEWELGLQIFTEEQAEQFSFDVLDATKLIPEELVPITPVGRMVLNRNPDNFLPKQNRLRFVQRMSFPASTFQTTPCSRGVFTLMWTPRYRVLAVPIFMRSRSMPLWRRYTTTSAMACIARPYTGAGSRMSPTRWRGGCPFQAGSAQGFMTIPARQEADDQHSKVRGKPEKFADHYTQATLFFDSQTPVEQAHIAAAFRFELSKLTVPALRERMVSSLRNVSEDLARQVARGLGISLMPPAMPRALAKPSKPEITRSPALSLMARPGDGSIAGRKVALLIAPGVVADSLIKLHAALIAKGAVPRWVAPRLGSIAMVEGGDLQADASLENEPGFLFDALVLPDGGEAVKALGRDAHTMEFIRDQYRHCKSILVFGASKALLVQAGVPQQLVGGAPDPGLVIASAAKAPEVDSAISTFMNAITRHRHPERDTDPPSI